MNDSMTVKCINPECDTVMTVEMLPYKLQYVMCPDCKMVTTVKLSPHKYYPSDEELKRFDQENMDACHIISSRKVE